MNNLKSFPTYRAHCVRGAEAEVEAEGKPSARGTSAINIVYIYIKVCQSFFTRRNFCYFEAIRIDILVTIANATFRIGNRKHEEVRAGSGLHKEEFEYFLSSRK